MKNRDTPICFRFPLALCPARVLDATVSVSFFDQGFHLGLDLLALGVNLVPKLSRDERGLLALVDFAVAGDVSDQ